MKEEGRGQQWYYSYTERSWDCNIISVHQGFLLLFVAFIDDLGFFMHRWQSPLMKEKIKSIEEVTAVKVFRDRFFLVSLSGSQKDYLGYGNRSTAYSSCLASSLHPTVFRSRQRVAHFVTETRNFP